MGGRAGTPNPKRASPLPTFCYAADMKRITFVVPEDLNALLEDERRRRDVPTAAVIREALASYFTTGAQDRTLPFIGIGHSGFHDTARNLDAILAEEWNADRGR
jgi:hypothetical protein